jgi:hypothetical protein
MATTYEIIASVTVGSGGAASIELLLPYLLHTQIY